MSNQKNKLRRGTNYKLWLYIGIIFFLILLGFGLYLAYMMIDYEAVYSTPVSFNVVPPQQPVISKTSLF